MIRASVITTEALFLCRLGRVAAVKVESSERRPKGAIKAKRLKGIAHQTLLSLWCPQVYSMSRGRKWDSREGCRMGLFTLPAFDSYNA